MITKIKQYFFNPVCFRCSSFFVEEHLFCELCFEAEISSRLDLKEREIEYDGKKFKHYYLFEWAPGESDLISKLIYQVKKDRCVPALRFYSNILVKQVLILRKEALDYNCVLALPGSSKKSVHSMIIAEQIAEKLKLKSHQVFRKIQSGKSQKQLSKDLRKDLVIEACPNRIHELITEVGADKLNPIYVDDVLTTGSTLKAAMKAIREQGPKEQGGCVMTLFFRPEAKAQLEDSK